MLNVCFGFALLRSVKVHKTGATFLTNRKPNPNQSWLARTRFPALEAARLYAFAWNPDWFIALFVSVVIGLIDYFGFGFTMLIWK